MTTIDRICGHGLVVRGDDIDTDQILPSRFLTVTSFAGIEAHVFADAREQARESGRTHPFDRAPLAGDGLLIVNRNFGCGSSREHAPQGLRRAGIAAIVGESFGEIFAANSVSIGMPCVQIDGDAIGRLQAFVEAHPEALLTMDLRAQTIAAAGLDRHPIAIAPGRRDQFLRGTWDSITTLLGAGEEIERTLANLMR